MERGDSLSSKGRRIMRIDTGKLLFGHRGYSSERAENTLESFQKCIDEKVPGVELDVHLCATGELVVAHDSSLKRTAGKDMLIEQTSLTRLKEQNVGQYMNLKGQIPLLSEVFAASQGKLYFDIEIKDGGFKDIGLEKKLWDTIREYHMEDKCLISSFNPIALRRFNTISKRKLDTAVIFRCADDVPKILWHGRCRHLAKCTYLKPDYHEIDRRMMDTLGKRYPIVAWAVDDTEEAKRLLDLGVAGLISNRPAILHELIK